jgi:type VI secretion system secreted protein Hcp
MPAFLKIDGVDGDSAHDDNHKKWIDVRAVGSEVSRTVKMVDTNAAQFGRGTTSFEPITLHCKLDSSWPQLAKNCADGKKHATAQIDLCRDEDNECKPYATIKLKNVLITDCDLQGSGLNDGESLAIRLGFTEIEWVFNKTTATGPAGTVQTTYRLMS